MRSLLWSLDFAAHLVLAGALPENELTGDVDMDARFAAAEANGIGCLGIRFGAGTDGRWACRTDNRQRRRGKLVDSSAQMPVPGPVPVAMLL